MPTETISRVGVTGTTPGKNGGHRQIRQDRALYRPLPDPNVLGTVPNEFMTLQWQRQEVVIRSRKWLNALVKSGKQNR